jgi:hypothetical protein
MSHQLELRLTATVAAAVGLLSLLGLAEPRAVSAATLTVLALVAFRMATPGLHGACPHLPPAPGRTACDLFPADGIRLLVTVARPGMDTGGALVEIRLRPNAGTLLVLARGGPAWVIAVDIHPARVDRRHG